MNHKIFFFTLLLSVCAFALLRGERDNRLVALICLTASALSIVMIRPALTRYMGVESGVMFVDILAFACFVAVALESRRFWPLWIAGLQLTTLLAHLFRGVDTEIIRKAYNFAAVFWSYPILIILAVGTWRADRRRRVE